MVFDLFLDGFGVDAGDGEPLGEEVDCLGLGFVVFGEDGDDVFGVTAYVWEKVG